MSGLTGVNRRLTGADPGLTSDSLSLTAVAGKDLVISPKAPRPFTLAQLLEGITDENIHEEIKTGPAVGNEVW